MLRTMETPGRPRNVVMIDLRTEYTFQKNSRKVTVLVRTTLMVKASLTCLVGWVVLHGK